MDITSYPLVWVRWIDARELDGWEDTEVAIDKCKAERLTIESTGRLIYDGEKRLVLVSDMADDGQHVNHQMIIPQVAVLERQEIHLSPRDGATTKTKKKPSKRTRKKRAKVSENRFDRPRT